MQRLYIERFYLNRADDEYPMTVRIQDYLKERFGIEIIRCCAEKYKVRQFEEVMAPSVCEQWKATPHYIPFEPNTTMISACGHKLRTTK